MFFGKRKRNYSYAKYHPLFVFGGGLVCLSSFIATYGTFAAKSPETETQRALYLIPYFTKYLLSERLESSHNASWVKPSKLFYLTVMIFSFSLGYAATRATLIRMSEKDQLSRNLRAILGEIREAKTNRELYEYLSPGINIKDAPDDFLCTISGNLMANPVLAEDGYHYERENLLALYNRMQESGQTPICYRDQQKALASPQEWKIDRSLQSRIKIWASENYDPSTHASSSHIDQELHRGNTRNMCTIL